MRELEGAECDLGRLNGNGAQPRARARVRAQRLKILAHRAELARADVDRLSGDRLIEAPDDGIDEILHGEQLVAVRAAAEDRDPPPLPDPVEQDLEHAEPLRPDEGLRPHDHRLQPAP